MNNDVLYVSFSAFFADLGYQTAIAIFPIFLVGVLGASAAQFGIASAVAFGIGSFFGYLGGIMSDRLNDKYVAILGNALIPLISLMGLAESPTVAVMLFAGGWWARNFRSPSRRAMLVDSSRPRDRGIVFGFLHMLDIGGGVLSIAILLVLIVLGVSYSKILLLTAIPLVISTLLLFPTRKTKRSEEKVTAKNAISDTKKAISDTKKSRSSNNTYKGIMIATAMYGFSSYSFGFPILTIDKESTPFLAILAYGLYLAVSAGTGYYIGSRKWKRIKTLGILGYMLSGIGTLVLAAGYFFNEGIFSLYIGVALLGFGLGVIETMEPTLISFIKSIKDVGRGLGALAGYRSLGIFAANLIMGILYVFSPAASYLYAAIVAVIAGFVVLFAGRDFE